MNKVSNGRFTIGASNTDEAEISSGMTIVGRQKFNLGALKATGFRIRGVRSVFHSYIVAYFLNYAVNSQIS